MRYLIRSSLNQEGILAIKQLQRGFSCLLVVIAILILSPLMAQAKIQLSEAEDGKSISRSLESLRDLDYQTWQVVVYPKNSLEEDLVLRIVGYPGTLRMDHPTALEVHAGLRDWLLKDITLSNPKLANDSREAAAEFDLTPLLIDLSNNRPLRLMLPNVFSDLPIPPYLVKEWRSLIQHKLLDEKG